MHARTSRITEWRDLVQTEASLLSGTEPKQIKSARLYCRDIRDSEIESREQIDAPVGRTIRERSVRSEPIRRIKES